jgi:hydrogenase maturation protease
MTSSGAVVVLGIGNILMEDEGLGVHAVRALRAHELPPSVAVVDGGTLGIELLPIVGDADALVLIDAARFGGEPGELRAFRGEALSATYGMHVSPHQAGAADLVAVARLTGVLPVRCTLFGVEPSAVGFGLELSEPVSRALPVLLKAVIEEVHSFCGVSSYA